MDQWEIRNKEEEYSVSFNNSLVEKCLGKYTRVCKKMQETEPFASQWTLQTSFSVVHPVGSFSCVCNLYYNGQVVIYDTQGQVMRAHNINDIRFLKKAVLWLGWNSLTVIPSEIDSSIDFWRRTWETGLIDSDYLEKKYKRKQ
jgi:hypothetical protein